MFGRQLHASWVFIVLKCSYLTTSTTLSITEVGFVTSPLTLKQARRTSAGAFGLKSNSSDRNNGDRGQQGRVPWDVLRFVQQSSRFVRLPNPLQFLGDNQKRVIYPGM